MQCLVHNTPLYEYANDEFVLACLNTLTHHASHICFRCGDDFTQHNCSIPFDCPLNHINVFYSEQSAV